jgi:aerobic-type carbon monoxide dehydrogenase small subunit (CoxS/CutS family)
MHNGCCGWCTESMVCIKRTSADQCPSSLLIDEKKRCHPNAADISIFLYAIIVNCTIYSLYIVAAIIQEWFFPWKNTSHHLLPSEKIIIN